MRHKDGKLIWVHLNARRMGPLSDNTRFYEVFTGMSAETRLFQSIANETADGIYVIDKENYDLLYVSFHGMDPNWVVNHAYNMASYLFDNENPIKDGDTIDGIADGEMNRAVQWVCRYEQALIQPAREVIDVSMGAYASGNRERQEGE